MELNLSGCSISHIPKDGKKKKHELKIVHQGADALVLAVQSKEQAEEWLKVKAVNCLVSGFLTCLDLMPGAGVTVEVGVYVWDIGLKAGVSWSDFRFRFDASY